MKGWLRRLGIALAVTGTLLFVGHVLSSLDIDDLHAHLSARAVAAGLIATLLYSLTAPVSAFAWQRLLANLGCKKPFARLNAILLTTQVGKYLPGNVGQHLGRIGLALAEGIPAAILTASIVYEVLLLILTGVLVGVICGAFSEPGLSRLLHDHAWALATAVGIAVAGLAAVPLLGKALSWAAARVARTRGIVAAAPRLSGWKSPAFSILIYALAYLLIGAATSVLAHGLFPDAALDFMLLTAAFALAWVVGFITPGAPAGIGVREALLLLMLGGTMAAADTSLLILALRVVTTLGDMLCLAAGTAQMAWLRRSSLGDGRRT